jgi:hypothetical protein
MRAYIGLDQFFPVGHRLGKQVFAAREDRRSDREKSIMNAHSSLGFLLLYGAVCEANSFISPPSPIYIYLLAGT